jgi:outer membrane protein assembly factor BamB
MKRFLFLGLITNLIISMSFPPKTNSERPDKTILWTRNLGQDQGFKAPKIDSDRIYVTSPTKVLCYGLDSGELLWKREFQASTKPFYSEFISLHKKYALYGNPNGLICFDKINGKVIWENDLPLTSNTEIVGDFAYAAFQKTVRKIDINTGKILLEKEFETKDDYSFLTVAGHNKIFITTVRNIKRMVNLTTGKVIWENDSLIHTILDKPIISGKCVVVSGYQIHYEYLMFFDLETGKIVKNLPHYNNQMDASDGRVLTSNFCYSTETLEPLWKADGYSRFFDCFDAVFVFEFDEMTIVDWNGNKIYSKKKNYSYVGHNERVWLKPASSNGKYALITDFLVCYQNKPESITYSVGNGSFFADGKKVSLTTKPFANENGELMVEPRGFLEPLGWVSSHTDNWLADEPAQYMVFHDYKREIAITDTDDPKIFKKYIKAEKIIKCQKTPYGKFVMPLDQMVTEFGLTMTKDGDKIKLSYQGKQ